MIFFLLDIVQFWLIDMTNIPLLVGFWIAFLHVLSGPDHLAAVTPIILEHKVKHWKIGLFWGFGHLLGMLFIGIIYLLFKEKLPIEQISSHSELLVGFVLIFLGLWSFYKIKYDKNRHAHPHVHNSEKPYLHLHRHEHENNHLHKHIHKNNITKNEYTSLSIGILHGFAGIAHFILFLPVFGFSSQFDAFQYIFGFSIGTLFAMVVFSLLIGKLTKYSKNQNNQKLYKRFRLMAGIIAIVVGLIWIFHA